MEIKYTRQGDYLIPNLYLDKDDDCGIIGKYGTLRLHFIAQNKQALYETLLKELNPIEWTKLMNNYKNMAEEIVLNEYVFV